MSAPAVISIRCSEGAGVGGRSNLIFSTQSPACLLEANGQFQIGRIQFDSARKIVDGGFDLYTGARRLEQAASGIANPGLGQLAPVLCALWLRGSGGLTIANFSGV